MDAKKFGKHNCSKALQHFFFFDDAPRNGGTWGCSPSFRCSIFPRAPGLVRANEAGLLISRNEQITVIFPVSPLGRHASRLFLRAHVTVVGMPVINGVLVDCQQQAAQCRALQPVPRV